MSNKYIRNICLKIRLHPTNEQQLYLNNCFGCTRFVYNYYLNERDEFYKKNVKDITDKSLRKQICETFKETPLSKLKERNPWLKKVEACRQFLNWLILLLNIQDLVIQETRILV